MSRDTVRLIGGRWRSRLLKFPEKSSIRPTSARVRETVFNWLSSEIQNAVCLDAFAGSGALGFEALSRGARWVQFIDQSPQVVKYLKQQIMVFSAQEMTYVHLGTFLPTANDCALFNCLKKQTPDLFTIVFLDPPFYQDLVLPYVQQLEMSGVLSDKAWIYIEHEQNLKDSNFPKNWQLLKSKKTSQVHYSLWQRSV